MILGWPGLPAHLNRSLDPVLDGVVGLRMAPRSLVVMGGASLICPVLPAILRVS
jgi:hypothetical protein